MNKHKLNIILFIISCGGILVSCQKSFDPNSYKPVYSINGYTSSSQVAASNLVAYWAFENDYIDSVSKTEGTPVNASAVSFVPGVLGQAVEVASPGYINTNIANTIAGLQTFTYAVWLKHESSLDPNASLFSYIPWSLNSAGFSWEQSKYFMLFNNADQNGQTYGKVCVMDQWFDVQQTWPAMLDGNWHDLVVSFNGTNGALRVYVDGTLFTKSSSTTLTGALPFSNFGTVSSFTLGGPDDNANAANGWMNSLSGDMDEFRVFNRELTADEVHALYMLQFKGL